MRPLTVSDAEAVIVGLQQEIQRSEESRYDHRLHGVLLVAQGWTCPQVGHLLGDAPRSTLVAPTWSLHKQAVLQQISQELERRKTYQGRDYIPQPAAERWGVK